MSDDYAIGKRRRLRCSDGAEKQGSEVHRTTHRHGVHCRAEFGGYLDACSNIAGSSFGVRTISMVT
jgi:hypothetical protein